MNTATQAIDEMELIINRCAADDREMTQDEKDRYTDLKALATEKIKERTAMPAVTANIRTSKNEADKSYSVVRMMDAVSNARNIDGVEAEYDSEMKHTQSWRNWGGCAVPMENIFLTAEKRQEISHRVQKASGVVSPTNLSPLAGEQWADQYRIETETAIQQELLAGQSGAHVAMGLTEQTVIVPIETATTSAGFVLLDSDFPTSDDPAYTQGTMEPHPIGGVGQVNKSSFLATHLWPGGSADNAIASKIRNSVIHGIDRAFLLGDSATVPAEPDGLVTKGTDTGLQIVHDDTAQDTLIQIVKGLRDYLKMTNPDARWIMSQDVLESFRTISAFALQSGANSLAVEAARAVDQLLGFRTVGTTAFPTDTSTSPDSVDGLFLEGKSVIQGFWQGIDIAINPWADSVFNSGAVLVRSSMMTDTLVSDPKRVRKFLCDLTVDAV